jgi:putative endonuclease
MKVDKSGNWFVYIILASDNSYYTGITTDPQRRWRQHCDQTGGAKFFRGRRPKKFLYAETGHTRSSASRREAAIKKLGRRAKSELIDSSNNECASLHLSFG